MLIAVGYVLAVGIGLSLGLLGGGGSILAVPILIYVMGVESSAAIAMSLFIVGSVSLLGVIPHARRGFVHWRIAAIFLPTAMVGSYLGSQLVSLPLITDAVQLTSFGIVMLAASLLMIWKGHGKGKIIPVSASGASVSTGSQFFSLLLVPAEGFGVGLITGFVGVGGGFLIIPALVLLSNIPMKTAIGTSLLIIACNSAVGFIGYLNQISVDWALMLSFTFAAGIGTLMGSTLSKSVEASRLQKGFGYFVLTVAMVVLVKQ
ncbi:MAG: sulfite exporter TauE/SafE family protein [Phormidesmis sp. RL_2_1]|nr:sulfite exporter TauE/SafE family protein [Phormidesmis sp. RL_2_1]